MVIERVEFEVLAGREEEFLRHIQVTRGVIDNSKGCQAFTFGRGVENPAKMILLVTWDSIEAHAAAKEPSEYCEWAKQLPGFFAGRPTMEHFAV